MSTQRFPSGRNLVLMLERDLGWRKRAKVSRNVSEFRHLVQRYDGPKRVAVYSDATGDHISLVPIGRNINPPVFKAFNNAEVKITYQPKYFEARFRSRWDGSIKTVLVYYYDMNGVG